MYWCVCVCVCGSVVALQCLCVNPVGLKMCVSGLLAEFIIRKRVGLDDAADL